MHYILNMGFVMQDQLVYSAEHEFCVKCYCNCDEMQW